VYAVLAVVWFIYRIFARPASLSRVGHCRTMLADGCCYLVYIYLLVDPPLTPPFIVRESACRTQCANNLHQIGLAMASYSAKFGTYPPAWAVDGKGRATVSWRVLLLPYFDDLAANKVYKNVRLSEPWDSPHNRDATAGSGIERFFHCPTAGSPEDETNYAMVVGPDTISDGPHSVRPGEIKDLSHMIVVAEVVGTGIHWAEPRDLDFKTMPFQINSTIGSGVSSAHRGGVIVLFADGKVHMLSASTDPKIVRAALLRNGGAKAKEIEEY